MSRTIVKAARGKVANVAAAKGTARKLAGTEGADLMAATLIHKLKPQSLDALMAELRKQTSAPRPQNAPNLETEKDGRLYAISMFESMEEASQAAPTFSVHSAEAEEVYAGDSNMVLIYRDRPQADIVSRSIAELHKYGTPAAIGGFNVVLTDYIGSVIEGAIPNPASEFYADMEKEGKLEPWGSVIYRDPAKAAAALAAGENAYRIGGPEAIEAKKKSGGK